jgi:hypothetical protein
VLVVVRRQFRALVRVWAVIALLSHREGAQHPPRCVIQLVPDQHRGLRVPRITVTTETQSKRNGMYLSGAFITTVLSCLYALLLPRCMDVAFSLALVGGYAVYRKTFSTKLQRRNDSASG